MAAIGCVCVFVWIELHQMSVKQDMVRIWQKNTHSQKFNPQNKHSAEHSAHHTPSY